MSGYAAFLRGMNVGGHRIGSAELCACFKKMGFGDAHSFRASGNVIFADGDGPPTDMAVRIEAGLAASLGYEVPVFLRSASEVRAIAAQQPFAPKLVSASRGKLQVAMLAGKPVPAARSEVLALASDEDQLAWGEREIYWLPSGGILDSALDWKAIGKLVGPMTTRTMNTVAQIAAKYFAG
jgi:uncharacterized protein (DUF1697 family)